MKNGEAAYPSSVPAAQAPGGTAAAGTIVDGRPSGSGQPPSPRHESAATAHKAVPRTGRRPPRARRQRIRDRVADLVTGHLKLTNAAAGGRDLNDLGANGQGKRGKKGVEEGDRRSARPDGGW